MIILFGFLPVRIKGSHDRRKGTGNRRHAGKISVTGIENQSARQARARKCDGTTRNRGIMLKGLIGLYGKSGNGSEARWTRHGGNGWENRDGLLILVGGQNPIRRTGLVGQADFVQTGWNGSLSQEPILSRNRR